MTDLKIKDFGKVYLHEKKPEVIRSCIEWSMKKLYLELHMLSLFVIIAKQIVVMLVFEAWLNTILGEYDTLQKFH